MRFLEVLGLQTRADTDTQGTAPVIPSRSATSVTLDSALSISAVFAAFRVLTTAASQLEMGVWRNGEEITPTPLLIAQPDINETTSQFLKRVVTSLAGTGNAYLKVTRKGDGTPQFVTVLDPLLTAPEYTDKGIKQYRSVDPITRRSRVYSAREVVHLRLLEVPGHLTGLGPIQACRSTYAGALDLAEYSDNWFSQSGIPTGVLSTDMQLTPDEADAYRARWEETQAKRGTAVLGKGLSYSPVMLNPADAQFLESRQFSVTDIARLFGIPAAYLLAEVNGAAMTYQNISQADTAFLKYTLMQYLKEIEDALSGLLPRGQQARFKTDGLLRPDPATQATIHKVYVDMGALSVEEVRAEKGWDGPAPVKQGGTNE